MRPAGMIGSRNIQETSLLSPAGVPDERCTDKASHAGGTSGKGGDGGAAGLGFGNGGDGGTGGGATNSVCGVFISKC